MALPAGWTEVVPRPKPGGQGETFHVTHDSRRGDYCLKRLRNVSSEVRKLRFEREVNTMRVLRAQQLTSIPEIVEAGTDSAGRPYFVYPWIRVCLADYVDGAERLKPKDAFAYARQLAFELKRLHDMGYAHRDIKPSNLLSDGSTLQLADFGLTLPADPGSDRLTDTVEAIGSRLYLAPELAAGRWNEPDQRPADLYSFGKTLWALMSGRSPMDREQHRDPQWRLGQLLGDERFDLLNALLDRLLEPDPRGRMSNWDDVIRELEWVEDQVNGKLATLDRQLSPIVIERADRIRRQPQLAAKERESGQYARIRQWFNEVSGRLLLAVHTIDAELARLKQSLGPNTVCRIQDGDTVPWLDALAQQLNGLIQIPSLSPVVTDVRGSPTIQIGIANSQPSMRMAFYVEVIGSEGKEELWLARVPLLYPPVDRASATPYTVNFADGPWPGRVLTTLVGPLPLFLESSLSAAVKFGEDGAADWLRLVSAYVTLLERDALLESAERWRIALSESA